MILLVVAQSMSYGKLHKLPQKGHGLGNVTHLFRSIRMSIIDSLNDKVPYPPKVSYIVQIQENGANKT